jgi:hypothetical protein
MKYPFDGSAVHPIGAGQEFPWQTK